jgi:glycosyltransferase involved in cell wall biosynthesis
VTRVLLVHQPVDGGVGRHVADLANGLVGGGAEVTVCGPGAPIGLDGAVSQIELPMGRAVDPREDVRAVGRLARVVRDLRPHVVHAHSSKAGAVARLARARTLSVPLVYSPHLYAFAGHFERPGERLAYRAFEALLAPAATRVVCVCESEAVLARTIGPARRVRVVHNGVPAAAEITPDEEVAALAPDGSLIGVVSHLQPRKGLDVLLSALPSVLARHPAARVAVVGEGPALKGLRSHAEMLGVGHAVHFLGPRADPRRQMRAMSVFVLPSLAEAFPYVVLEAMSVGTPVVASDVGGVSEAIRDGGEGRLVPAGDASSLAAAIGELLDDRDARARMGANAAARVSESFTLPAMVEGITGVYSEILA